MSYTKAQEEKEQKQLRMAKLQNEYKDFLAQKVSEKKNILLSKYPDIKTAFEGFLSGAYIVILDNKQESDRKGKLYYLFENIPESDNKYKLSYEIIDNNCVFETSALKNFPKSYLTVLKRHKFDIKKGQSEINELLSVHTDALKCPKKAKDLIKMEYRACDLYYNHNIPTEKIAATLRNRLKKTDIERIIKLYPYFKIYNKKD